MMQNPPTNIYLKNEDLLNELIWCKANDVLTPELVKMFDLLIIGVHKKLHYYDPADREDCMSGAMFNCLKMWKKFNHLKSDNAFSYFTQVVKTGSAATWNKLHDKGTRYDINVVFGDSDLHNTFNK